MRKVDLTKDEELIAEAILDARKVQEYLWQELSLINYPYEPKLWEQIFAKRLNKIREIDPLNPHARVELRKRIMQQTALGICALRVLDEESI
jgi:hypothetical protein